jgi:hypothetical protein
VKEFWSIPGPKHAPNLPCYAFRKYDGSNFRAEWSRKRGWYKFGTRTQIIDRTHPDFGKAVDVFLATQAGPIEKVFRDERGLRSFESALVFGEFLGPNSFAGQHVAADPKEVVLFDVNLHKRGLMPPREFLQYFSHLRHAELVYQGNFNESFKQDVREGKYGQNEGVVAKGSVPGKKEQHSLWMSKVKTNWWLEELKSRAATNVELRKTLEDNQKEQ